MSIDHHRPSAQPPEAEHTGPQRLAEELRLTHEMDQAPSESQLLESFRVGDTDPAQIHRRMELAVQLAETGDLSEEAAQELVGAAHELAGQAESSNKDALDHLFTRLKQAVYGTADVQPVALVDGVDPSAHPAQRKPIKDSTRVFEWHGSPIGLRVLGEQLLPDGVAPNVNAGITLRLGAADTWYMQIGEQTPFALPKDEAVSAGRDELGGNVYTSRKHLTLKATPPVGIEVADHSELGTHYSTNDYPDPAEFRAEHPDGPGGRHRAPDEEPPDAEAARRKINEL